MNDAPRVTGSCLCGAVRFAADAAPLVTRVCWCRLCQKLGAGGPTVNAGFPAAAMRIEGALSDHRSVADSGSVMHRRFCPRCGVHMFSEAESRPHLIYVRAGALDNPEIARPTMTIWTAQAPSWACFDPDIPQLEGQPPPPPQR